MDLEMEQIKLKIDEAKEKQRITKELIKENEKIYEDTAQIIQEQMRKRDQQKESYRSKKQELDNIENDI